MQRRRSPRRRRRPQFRDATPFGSLQSHGGTTQLLGPGLGLALLRGLARRRGRLAFYQFFLERLLPRETLGLLLRSDLRLAALPRFPLLRRYPIFLGDLP